MMARFLCLRLELCCSWGLHASRDAITPSHICALQIRTFGIGQGTDCSSVVIRKWSHAASKDGNGIRFGQNNYQSTNRRVGEGEG